MKLKSKTIIFFGTDEFSAVSLQELIDKGFTIGSVVTKPDGRKGRGRAISEPAVKTIATAHHIPVWQPSKLSDIIANIKQYKNPVGVLVSYGKIIPSSIINLFSPGIINVHPSLLPLYRGPSPIESVIANGETFTGITIMLLSEAMDAGPIYSQVRVPLHDTETGPSLKNQLAQLGAQQLSLSLPAILRGTIQPTPQDDRVATYCQLLRKEDGVLNASHYSAEQVERRIRAFLAFPKTKTTIAGNDIIITKATVVDAPKTVLDIRCSDGRYISIKELISPSGKKMNGQAFLNGLRIS